jgi:phosphoglucomutase
MEAHSPELLQVPRLLAAYYEFHPDPSDPVQRVHFGTSGHRGSSLQGSFNQDHILAIAQAIAEHRAQQGIRGPLYLGMDTHALSEPAWGTVLSVLVANGVWVRYQAGRSPTPTPLVSHAILEHNRRGQDLADGILLTPSHNPPEDGGLKYNPPTGGPAGPEVTRWIERRANQILSGHLKEVRRVSLAQALEEAEAFDFIYPYVEGLGRALDLVAIRAAGVRIGVDPLGGASMETWFRLAERYGLALEVVHTEIDPRFAFMPPDHDGKIRMDCSSPYAMARLLELKDRFDVALGTDPDTDRHGIVTHEGLMNPNHYLSVCVDYLFSHRSGWPETAGVGKTLVTTSMIDRIAEALNRPLFEVPVGFKFFVEGLLQGSLGFAGEESAGASFLDQGGQAWSTDKDGLLLGLLAAEMLAKEQRSPAQHYRDLEARFGASAYRRVDAPATLAQKRRLAELTPEDVPLRELAGEPVIAKIHRAPGNGAPLEGIKVVTPHAWFAARPSGTEEVYKIYAESFLGEDHLEELLRQARTLIDDLLLAQ